MESFITLGALTLFILLLRMFRVIPMRALATKERLGAFKGVLKPGFHFIVPFIDRISYIHDSREQVIDIPKQRCITRDNVEIDVDGIVYLKVTDAQKASYGIGNYHAAVISLAQTTMRSEIGKLNLDDTFRERDKVNEKIVHEIDKASEPWGIKFIRYEIRSLDPSANMLNTMEKQMEAERQKRADITFAQGEKQARINVSEGEKQAAINLSEGEKQKRINEAEGRSRERPRLSPPNQTVPSGSSSTTSCAISVRPCSTLNLRAWPPRRWRSATRCSTTARSSWPRPRRSTAGCRIPPTRG